MPDSHPDIAEAASAGWDGKPRPFARPFKLRLGYTLYQILIHLGLPLIFFKLLQLSKREPLYRENLHQRLGLGGPSCRNAIWIFAASLGETRAIAPVIRKLLEIGEPILLTHSSAAGLKAGRDLFGDDIKAGRIVQRYQPIDASLILWLFLFRFKPRAGLVVECELWPGLMIEPRRFGLPMLAVNGSYTERAHSRDKNRAFGLRMLFWQGFAQVTTKSKGHADRYARTGLAPNAIHTVGELRFDLPLRTDLIAHGKAARSAFDTASGPRPVLMIASSIEGEEGALLDVIKTLHRDCEKPPLVVWVPRSPQRFDAVGALVAEAGFRVAARSDTFEGFELESKVEFDVLIGNSLGEMDFYYAMSDVVFVGATLFPMGGHNPIEPLAHEKPVVTGPSIYGIAFPAYEARDAGALRDFETREELAQALVTLFETPGQLEVFANHAKGFNGEHKGATERTLEVLRPLLMASPK